MNNLLTTGDLSRDELDLLLDSAGKFKSDAKQIEPIVGNPLPSYFHPSLRTRASMQVGIYELGGNPVF